MPDEHDELEDAFGDLIAEQRAAGGDTKTLSDLRKAYRRAKADARDAETRGYERARQEIEAQGARRTAFDRLGVPTALEGLFQGLDPTDSAAMDAKVAELKTAGIQWAAPGAPPATEQQPDRTGQQVAGMAAATSGGQVPVPSGDLQAQARKALTDPGSVDPDEFLRQVNEQIRNAGAGPGAGIQG